MEMTPGGDVWCVPIVRKRCESLLAERGIESRVEGRNHFTEGSASLRIKQRLNRPDSPCSITLPGGNFPCPTNSPLMRALGRGTSC